MRLFLKAGDKVIDATAGNGYDTLFLAQTVGPSGHVIAFDIQACALANTKMLLEKHGILKGVLLVHAGHEDMLMYTPSEWHKDVKAIVFNLGYLPKGDKTITTMTSNTLKALNVALRLLHPEGALWVVVYPGHEEGKREAQAIEVWLHEFCQKFDVQIFKNEHTLKPCPYALRIQSHLTDEQKAILKSKVSIAKT